MSRVLRGIEVKQLREHLLFSTRALVIPLIGRQTPPFWRALHVNLETWLGDRLRLILGIGHKVEELRVVSVDN